MKKYKQGSNLFQMHLLVRCTLMGRWSFTLTFIFLMLYQQTRYCTNRQIFKLAFFNGQSPEMKMCTLPFYLQKNQGWMRLMWNIAATERCLLRPTFTWNYLFQCILTVIYHENDRSTNRTHDLKPNDIQEWFILQGFKNHSSFWKSP